MLHLPLQLLHPLLPVRGEAEVLLHAPEHGGTGLDRGLGQHVVQNGDLKRNAFKDVCV